MQRKEEASDLKQNSATACVIAYVEDVRIMNIHKTSNHLFLSFNIFSLQFQQEKDDMLQLHKSFCTKQQLY